MKNTIIASLFFALSILSCAQTKNDILYVGHWNLENLFDTVDDPKTIDEEFLPTAEKQWTEERLDKKLYNISRIIRTMNNDNGPDLLGVCEVEHEALLDSMINKFLSDKTYKVAYLESPDARGIDNGLIYNYKRLSVLNVQGLKIDLGDNSETRLILFVSLLLDNKDTLYCFINHWPSRRGGEKESEWRRVKAANVLKEKVDELLNNNPLNKIIIVGDFNDEPGNISITDNLKAEPLVCDSTNNSNKLIEDKKSVLFNLAYQNWAAGEGTFFYHEDFNMLDQIIISRGLLIGDKIGYICNSFKVYKQDMMITHSGKYKGAPFPTYGGSRYLGGYSDHFPVVAEFRLLGE